MPTTAKGKLREIQNQRKSSLAEKIQSTANFNNLMDQMLILDRSIYEYKFIFAKNLKSKSYRSDLRKSHLRPTFKHLNSVYIFWLPYSKQTSFHKLWANILSHRNPPNLAKTPN